MKFRSKLFVFGLLFSVLLLDLIFYPSTLEDACITFRYSQHLAQGHGLGAWNTDGSRVEGYTTFLWMTTLGLGEWLGIRCVTFSKILGIASHLGLCSFFLFLAYRRPAAFSGRLGLFEDNGAACKLAAVWLGLHIPVAWYATTGMETVPFALLVSLVLVAGSVSGRGWTILSIVASILIILTRPEGVLFVFAVHAFGLYEAHRTGASLETNVLGAAGGVAAFVFLTILRWVTYEEFFPNTYYAKAEGALMMHVWFGMRFVAYWVAMNPAILGGVILFAALVLRSKESVKANRWGVFLLVFVLAYFVFIIKVGGDDPGAFPMGRHQLHIGPLLALLGSMAVVKVLPGRAYSQFAVVAVALLLTNVAAVHMCERVMTNVKHAIRNPRLFHHEPPSRYSTWLKEYSSEDAVIATSRAGEIPFVVDAVFIDMLGLNDSHIAHHGKFDPRGPIDTKTDMDYVLKREPDMIDGFISGNGIKLGRTRRQLVTMRRKMLSNMLEHAEFKENYLFLLNGPYDSLDRALFVRRGFWEEHPRKDEMKVVPVTETSLYEE